MDGAQADLDDEDIPDGSSLPVSITANASQRPPGDR